MNLRQCNIEGLEEAALAVSTLDSPRYGRHLSSGEVCKLISCPDRDEGVRAVLEWVLGEETTTTVAGGERQGRKPSREFEWEEGEWLRGESGSDDVMVKVGHV